MWIFVNVGLCCMKTNCKFCLICLLYQANLQILPQFPLFMLAVLLTMVCFSASDYRLWALSSASGVFFGTEVRFRARVLYFALYTFRGNNGLAVVSSSCKGIRMLHRITNSSFTLNFGLSRENEFRAANCKSFMSTAQFLT